MCIRDRSIITRTLDDLHAAGRQWVNLQRRRLIYKTCQALLEAPSIIELGLLRPQLAHLLGMLEEKQDWSPIFESLLPVITNMRDSERVELIEDRLVYLNQAMTRLRQLQEQLDGFAPSIERTLAQAITRRWSGLLTAEIEEQRGRAELEVALMTKRLAPNGQTHVALEIRNTGRAAAENVVATLDRDPAYRVLSEPQTIPLLPSGRTREVRFLVEPQAEARFRVGMSLTYDDRNRRDKVVAYSHEGRRLWSSNLARDADRQVMALLPAGKPVLSAQPSLAVVLKSASESSDLADVLLLGNNGQTLANLNDTDLPRITRLVDLNRDEQYELLLARFAKMCIRDRSGLVQAGPFVIDEQRHQVWGDNQELNLTASQFAILARLCRNAGQVVRGEDLELAVWGDVLVNDPDRLKTLIKRLRRAIDPLGNWIVSERGVGYALRPPEDE